MHLRSLAPLLFSLGACGGDDDLVVQPRVVPEFTSLVIAEDLSAEIGVGDAAVTLEMDADLVDHVVTEVEGGVLHVGARPGGPALHPSSRARVRILTPRLTAVTASGGATVVASSGEPAVQLTAKDSARIELLGSASSVAIATEGAAWVDSQTAAAAADVKSRDASRVRVRVAERLSAHAADAARITVLGQPPARAVEAADGASVVFGE